MKEERLTYSWPETGELTVQICGNLSATLQFTPSPEAVVDGLRKAGVEAVYEAFPDGHPHTHGDKTEAL